MCFFIFAFSNHTSVLTAISEITYKTRDRINQLIHYTKNLEMLVYLLIMIIGYFSTFEKTPDIFIDRDDQGAFMVFGKVFYLIFLVICIGLCYYLNKSTFEWFFNNSESFSERQNLIYCTLVLTTMTVISLELSQVTAIMSLIGGTGQIYLMFILPVAMYNKAFNPPENTKLKYLAFTWIFTIIGVFNTIVIIVDAIKDLLI
jgi:amino acid permease